MVKPALQFELEPLAEPETITVGEVRKYGLDDTWPKWKHLFFRHIHLRYLRFCFKKLGIPALGSADKDGRFSWVEPIIFTHDADTAVAACQDEFYSVKTYNLDEQMPLASVQVTRRRYPNSVMPDRYRRLVHPLTVKSKREVEAERKAMATLYQKVEGLGAKIRAPVT